MTQKKDERSDGTNGAGAECSRTRLVRGPLASVDACECGMLHLHVGALTLRLTPCAFSELVSALNEAAIANAERSADADGLRGPLGAVARRGTA